MNTVRITKADLKTIVATNRAAHRKQFEAALEGFRKKAIERIEEMLSKARRSQPFNMWVGLEAPEDHTADYDRVLMMLDFSVDDIIEMTATNFDNYVRDRWAWSEKFKTVNSTYGVDA